MTHRPDRETLVIRRYLIPRQSAQNRGRGTIKSEQFGSTHPNAMQLPVHALSLPEKS